MHSLRPKPLILLSLLLLCSQSSLCEEPVIPQAVADDFACLNAIIEKAPHPDDFWARGVLYYRAAEFEKALEDFDSAIARDPEFGHFYYWRGATRFAQTRYQESIADFTQAIAFEPSIAMFVYECRGDAKYKMGNLSGALEDYERAIEATERESLSAASLHLKMRQAKTGILDPELPEEIGFD